MSLTTIERTLLDLAGIRGASAAVGAATGSAFRQSLTDPDVLIAFVDELANGRRGARRLMFEARMRRESGLRDSQLEDRFWALIARSDLPNPEQQLAIEVGGRRYVVDFAYPGARVAIECDGFEFHGGTRFRSDRRRRAALTSAGWRVIELTSWDVMEQPRWVLETIRSTLHIPS